MKTVKHLLHILNRGIFILANIFFFSHATLICNPKWPYSKDNRADVNNSSAESKNNELKWRLRIKGWSTVILAAIDPSIATRGHGGIITVSLIQKYFTVNVHSLCAIHAPLSFFVSSVCFWQKKHKTNVFSPLLFPLVEDSCEWFYSLKS